MKKLDIDNEVENAINFELSDEEIVAEYIENDEIEQEAEKEYLFVTNNERNEISLIKQISEYLTEKPCCSKNCCSLWKKEDLIKHAQDMDCLSKSEKKIVILTILRNSVFTNKKTLNEEQRQRLRFSFRYEPFGVMCASAFRLLFDLKQEAFKGLLAYFKTNNMSVVPPIHGNKGKKSRKPDTLIAYK